MRRREEIYAELGRVSGGEIASDRFEWRVKWLHKYWDMGMGFCLDCVKRPKKMCIWIPGLAWSPRALVLQCKVVLNCVGTYYRVIGWWCVRNIFDSAVQKVTKKKTEGFVY